MVDMIVRLTVGVVLVLAVMNAAQGVAILARLARHVARRQPQWGLTLWLPAFTSVDDIRGWVEAWRGVLRSDDPVLAQIRTMARTVVNRHVYLTLLSHTWAIAVAAVAPSVV
jgi:hypothetical protein